MNQRSIALVVVGAVVLLLIVAAVVAGLVMSKPDGTRLYCVAGGRCLDAPDSIPGGGQGSAEIGQAPAMTIQGR